MERMLPGIKVYIACRSEAKYLLKGEERILSQEDLQSQKAQFAYIRDLSCNMESHPVEDLMKESQLPCGPVPIPEVDLPAKCVLLTNGIIPTKTLSSQQIQNAIKHIQKNGYEPELNTSIENAGWVVGVENEQLFQAAADGKKVTLIPTGLGTALFKEMFPKGELLSLG